jgi:NTP pyrophosphatase (non-canonical NTP hydrolase)
MNAYEYAPLARRTLKEMPDFRQHMIHMAMGVTGEFGELIDAVKKVCVYGKPYDHVNAIEEVGDVLWYIANMLPELMVDAGYLQRSLVRGYIHGLRVQQMQNVWKDCNIGELLLNLNTAVATKAAELPRLNPDEAPGTSHTVAYIEEFAGNVGILCGILGVDVQDAMQRNIEKLAKRYGDKYSDVAALNRDLGGERAVLEAKVAGNDERVPG